MQQNVKNKQKLDTQDDETIVEDFIEGSSITIIQLKVKFIIDWSSLPNLQNLEKKILFFSFFWVNELYIYKSSYDFLLGKRKY